MILKKKRVLITGGAGFIGSHLVDRLLELGNEVIVVDNESTGLRENVSRRAVYVFGDITNSIDLDRAFTLNLDAVFHVAGQASIINSFIDPFADIKTNIIGTVNVVQKCLEYKIPRLLFASSMTTYGIPSMLPISEDMPCIPISYYGIAKYAAERYVHTTASRTDLSSSFSVTSFRMFNVYGERQRLDNPYQGVMGIFMGNVQRGEPIIIHGDGSQTRDFVYIADVVNAWITAWENSDSYGEVFNIGYGQDCSIQELSRYILASANLNTQNYKIQYMPLLPGDPGQIVADISKAKKILDWEPKIDLRDGIRRTFMWNDKGMP